LYNPVIVSNNNNGNYRTNKYKPTDPSLTINRTSYSVIMKEGMCMLIDVAISGSRNVIEKEAENILK